MMVIGKTESKRPEYFQILKYARSVGWTDRKGWLLVCPDFQKAKHFRVNMRWIPADTRFEWVKTLDNT